MSHVEELSLELSIRRSTLTDDLDEHNSLEDAAKMVLKSLNWRLLEHACANSVLKSVQVLCFILQKGMAGLSWPDDIDGCATRLQESVKGMVSSRTWEMLQFHVDITEKDYLDSTYMPEVEPAPKCCCIPYDG